MATKKQKEPFIITEEMIEKATEYIPYFEKVTLATEQADACLEPFDETIDGIAKDSSLPIPQFYKERCGAKQYFLLYFFLTKYLHIEIKETAWNDEEYDYYASNHPFNQLERFKTTKPNLKDKVFNILYDFKELKKMLDLEIYNLKEGRNDTLTRLNDSISLFASPENVKQLNDLLQKTIGEVEVAQKKLNEKRAKAKKTETEKK